MALAREEKNDGKQPGESTGFQPSERLQLLEQDVKDKRKIAEHKESKATEAESKALKAEEDMRHLDGIVSSEERDLRRMRGTNRESDAKRDLDWANRNATEASARAGQLRTLATQLRKEARDAYKDVEEAIKLASEAHELEKEAYLVEKAAQG